MREQQLLNGIWDYRIGQGAYTKKQVPYSDLSVGISECKRIFKSIKGYSRAFLVLEGITYQAIVNVNGHELGTMYPYCQYRYEVTDILKDENEISVVIKDTVLDFGPSAGWENYSGITRDVYIEYTDKSIIKDVIWEAFVNEALDLAQCTVKAETEYKGQGEIIVKLQDNNGETVYETLAEAKEKDYSFIVSNPALWSPDKPTLYNLSVHLVVDGKLSDSKSYRVGFKRLEIFGRKFKLNGKIFFFHGVCRHELYGDLGHMVSDEQIRKDLQIIKDLGCNYVRLVHYPHKKKTLEIADEMGLFVSEEPGLWQAKMTDLNKVNGSIEVMRRTVIRDRNHVSVAFWLCFNECQLTEEFLKASVKVCRDNDRTRLISGANNMPKEYVKEVFPGSGVDFYTMHPYDSSSRLMREYAAYLTDKPLIFTEWGGLCVTDRLDTLKEEIYAIVEMEKNSDDKSQVLAGQSIWFWSEIYEFGRGLPACREGILKEGLFDMYRKPNLIAPYFKKFFEEARNAKPKEPEFNIYDIEAEGTTRAVGLSKAKCKKAAYERAINDALAPIEWMNTPKQVRKMKTGPVLPIDVKKIGELNVSLAKVPMVSSREDNVVIPINADALSIYIIGNVGMPKGFPIGGEYGEDAAKYIVEFEGGNKEEFILKNGYDITTAYAVYGPSRINPVAANSKRAIKYCNDIEFEEYVINLHEIKFEAHRKIEKLTVEAIGGYDILTYGVSIRVK